MNLTLRRHTDMLRCQAHFFFLASWELLEYIESTGNFFFERQLVVGGQLQA